MVTSNCVKSVRTRRYSGPHFASHILVNEKCEELSFSKKTLKGSLALHFHVNINWHQQNILFNANSVFLKHLHQIGLHYCEKGFQIWENTDQKKIRIWTLFTLCIFCAISITTKKFKQSNQHGHEKCNRMNNCWHLCKLVFVKWLGFLITYWQKFQG